MSIKEKKKKGKLNSSRPYFKERLSSGRIFFSIFRPNFHVQVIFRDENTRIATLDK